MPAVRRQVETQIQKFEKANQRGRRSPSRARSPRSQKQRVFKKEGVVSWAEGCSEAQGGEDRHVSIAGGHMGLPGDLDGSYLGGYGILVAWGEMKCGGKTCKPLSQGAGYGEKQGKWGVRGGTGQNVKLSRRVLKLRGLHVCAHAARNGFQ